jgi:hypothetical protein
MPYTGSFLLTIAAAAATAAAAAAFVFQEELRAQADTVWCFIMYRQRYTHALHRKISSHYCC